MPELQDIFSDVHSAARCLQRLEAQPLSGALFQAIEPRLLAIVSASADPDRALVNFERFALVTQAGELFFYLNHHHRAIEILATLFAGSQFLTEILIRNPEYFDLLVHPKRLAQIKSAQQYQEEALAAASQVMSESERLGALRRYQRAQLLRIGACDLLNLFDLATVTLQLSNLADSLVQQCLEIIAQPGELVGFAVLAMGKLGGQELNYSSDIDLLLVAQGEAGRYLRIGKRLIEALASVSSEGFLYRVDMRLRPWGMDGALVSSQPGYLAYIQKHARLWEKQALLKARPVAGDLIFGEKMLNLVRPEIFSTRIEMVRASVHAMKQRTEEVLRQQGRGWGEVKLGEGSIRDVEFVVQFSQLVHGIQDASIHSRQTLEAIHQLAKAGWLAADEAQILSDGYIFLRTIEHYLQMMDYRQTYTLPADPEALALLARRLGFQSTDQFITRYQQHGAAIRAVYLRRVGSEVMTSQPPEEIHRHLRRMDASYALTFSETDIQRHANLADQLDAERLAVVDVEPLNGVQYRITIVGYDYPGELSIICGLMFVYGFNIISGEVFTYEPQNGTVQQTQSSASELVKKIVDVFTVTPLAPESLTANSWHAYSLDLVAFLQKLRRGETQAASGELARRVGAAFQERAEELAPLYPVDIELDNHTSDMYTVLRIDAPDTVGFLYELTNALAISQVYIARVIIQSVGRRVQDVLYVTDARGNKITAPGKQRELRAATVLIKHFTHLLPHSPNPETALLHFREFLGQLFQRPDWPDELTSIERSDVLHALAHVLGVSEFLWDDFLRMQYTNLFPVVRDVDGLAVSKSRGELERELEEALQAVPPNQLAKPDIQSTWRETLNGFKDREMFRIDMRHLLGHTQDFWAFAAELTDLAELVVAAAYQHCSDELREQYGAPQLENGQPCPASVLALGRCGGRELGFASDIELMFIYAGNGNTSGPKVIRASEYYEKLVQAFIAAIQARREGIFEIDLQLRPYGKAGSMAVSLGSFQRYYAPDGPAWAYERQALVKLRSIAGDNELGRRVEALRDQFVYHGDGFDVLAMRSMRERQVRHLVTGGTFNAKYSPGGLVDVEYLVQGLQIRHGAAHPELRLTNIRAALAALAEVGVLAGDEYARLRKAHTFLRWLIDALRVVRGHAKDTTIPQYDSEEFAFLARRLLYGADTVRLKDDLTRYAADVRELNMRLLG